MTGEETITYHNNSPDVLRYLWVQLDQNVREPGTNTLKISSSGIRDSLPAKFFAQGLGVTDYEGGFTITKVTDASGEGLDYFINKTMMRIELPEPLQPGEQFSFNIGWYYTVNDRMELGGRSGYEYFPKDDNYLYTIAQFYPRMAVYDDYNGWQNKQFLGRGEFALEFGDFKVEITVPADHIVASTGWLQNPKDVLTKTQH
ncbi:MAG: M1 family peptidase, partial [Cyclobacteriaceae bacterium]